MKKPRVSFASCFVGKGKDYVFVSGGFGVARCVIAESEIFNVGENFWTKFPAMTMPRASHSIILTDNMKWVYAFGGLDENN